MEEPMSDITPASMPPVITHAFATLAAYTMPSVMGWTNFAGRSKPCAEPVTCTMMPGSARRH